MVAALPPELMFFLSCALSGFSSLGFLMMSSKEMTVRYSLGTFISYGCLGGAFGTFIAFKFFAGRLENWASLFFAAGIGSGAIKTQDIGKYARRLMGVPEEKNDDVPH